MRGKEHDGAIERLGPDRIRRVGGGLIVEAATEMDGWEVRDFRRTEILYRGESYFVDGVDRHGGGMRYTLLPWPDSDAAAGTSIVYDGDYVTARQSLRRKTLTSEVTRPALALLSPLLGLLPSRVKVSLGHNLGLDPDRATGLSIFLETVTGVGLIVGFRILQVDPEMTPHVGKLLLGAAILLVDAAARYHLRLAEDPRYYGFYEWLLRRRSGPRV